MSERILVLCLLVLLASDAVADPCEKPLSSGGPLFVPTLFHLGDKDPSLGMVWGGRGYKYSSDRRWRYGGLGAGGDFGQDDQWTYSVRYGGMALERAFRFAREQLEVPVGLFVTMGGADLEEIEDPHPKDYPEGSRVVRTSHRTVFPVGAMAGFEWNALPWLKLGLSAHGLIVLNAHELLLAHGLGLNLTFGPNR